MKAGSSASAGNQAANASAGSSSAGEGTSSVHRPRVLFLGRAYAGHRTRFLNLQAHTSGDPAIDASYRMVTGWQEGGLIERAKPLPRFLRGRLRATVESRAFARVPRPDAIWTSAVDGILPYALLPSGPKRPLIVDLDSTAEQLETWAPLYFHRPPRTGAALRLLRLSERLVWRRATRFTPWSRWAANGLRAYGVEDEKIEVIPPGVDLEAWQPGERASTPGAKLKLLFVGGNFARKGGDMLLDVFRHRFAGQCELDIVTPEPVEASTGVRVHRATANSPALRKLYSEADLFVLPTRAECFGIATVEAMASGLPVVMGNVGAAAEIVPADAGWLIEPEPASLASVLETALERRASLPQMGRNARRHAEQRFDGKQNDERVLEVILWEIDRFRR